MTDNNALYLSKHIVYGSIVQNIVYLDYALCSVTIVTIK